MNGFQFIESDEQLTVATLFSVIYGAPGVGKTSLAFTMPQNCLLIDSDTGMHRAVPKMRPKTVRISNYGDFWKYVQSAEFEKFVRDTGLKSVIIDTVGALLEEKIAPWLISQDPKNGNYMGGLSLPGWGALKNNFSALKTRFQNLGLYVCCICHAREEGEGANKRFELAVSGGSADIIYRSADLIGFMSVTGDQRRINFSPTNMNIGKNIGGIPPQLVPAADTDEYDNFFESILNEAHANISKGGQSKAEMDAIIADWEANISDAKTADDFNALIKSASEIPGKALAYQIKGRIKTAYEKAGLTFDSKTKTVTDGSN